jgi:hypothetical protein
MAIRSGLAAQLGAASETTWGTAVTPDHFYEFLSEDINLKVDRLESKGLRSNNRVLRTDRWAATQQRIEGKIDLEVPTKGMSLWLKNALGSTAVSTPSGATLARLHRTTLGDPYGLGLTVQVGRPDTSGTVRAFTYAGCKVDSLSLSNSVGDFLKAEMNVVGKSETTATALATATYPITSGAASFDYLNWTQGAITIGGSPVGVVTDFSVEVNNNLKSDRYFLGAATMNEPIIAAMTEISGSMTVEFDGLTNYNRFVNGTIAAVTATWTGATAIEGSTYPSLLVNLANVRFDGDTPSVKGPDVITHDLKFKALYDGSTGPIVIDYTTSDTAV